jgi:hypothetical protein
MTQQEIKTLFKLLDFTVEMTPERYTDNKYQVWNKDYGLYTKKEAEMICAFLRTDAIRKMIWGVLNK